MSAPPDLDKLLGRTRDLTEQYLAGGVEAFPAFRELTHLLLRLTVMVEPDGGLRLVFGPRGKDRAVLEGWIESALVPLNDGRLLRFSVVLYLEEYEGRTRLKVEKSLYQYQVDERGDRWVVRYDYLRYPAEPHPGMHVQIRGALTEDGVLASQETLERIHFPTGRVALEAVIRMLVEQFHVPVNTPPEVWRPILAESEKSFHQIAHRSVSGPTT